LLAVPMRSWPKAIAVNAGRLWDANPTRPLHEALTRAAADYAGVSVEEFQRRWRAFGLARGEAVSVVGAHFDDTSSRGNGEDVTVAALRSIVMDPTMPEAVRDAAYRLAADPGLFNDLDVTHQTTTLTPTGFD
jgi:hypothetical protein